MTIHQNINLKQEIFNLSTRQGSHVAFAGKNKYNYAIDVSYFGTISQVGADPEDYTIYRDHLIEFSNLK